MTSRDFCYWLQGFFEIRDAQLAEAKDVSPLSATQTDLVKRHLALVFAHEIDPSAGPPAHQATLNEIHAPKHPADASKPHPQIGGTGPGGVTYRC